MESLFSRLTVALCLLAFVPAATLRAADDAAAPNPPPPTPFPAPEPTPLWLGDPGVDIANARDRFRRRYDDARRWEVEHNLAAYENAGSKDPRWNVDARETLRNASNFLSEDPGAAAAFRAEKAASARAVANGCDDPLIVYLSMRCGNLPPDTAKEKLARLYTDAETKLSLSKYPALRKYFAAVRAVKQDMACRRSVYGTVGEPDGGEMTPAASWADGTDITVAFQHGLEQLKRLLGDPDVPTMLYYDVTRDFIDAASADPIGRAEVLLPLEAYFTSGEPKGQHPAAAKMFAGYFWTTYAWDARGILGSLQMTTLQKKQYNERLDAAMAMLEQAWSLDPAEPQVPRTMITAAAGRGHPWAEIDQWFRRAMDARPNYYDAARAYLHFVQPRWGGTQDAMLKFGRRCLATQDAASQMPLILLNAHVMLAKDYSDDAEAYWRRPEVWADVRKVFECVTQARPDLPAYRTGYAIYAWRARDWAVAHEQFELVGDDPDPGELRTDEYTRDQFQDMRREAAAHATAQ